MRRERKRRRKRQREKEGMNGSSRIRSKRKIEAKKFPWTGKLVIPKILLASY